MRRTDIDMKLTRNRNLFNADCSTIFYNPKLWQPEGGPFSAKAVHRFVDVVADSGVDTLLINPNAQIAWYPSKVIPTNLDEYKRGDREFVRGHLASNPDPVPDINKQLDELCAGLNLYLDLVKAGVDWVAEMIAVCRRRRITPWSSVRMNDTHGAANPEGSWFNCPLYKNSKYRLSGKVPNPKDKPFVWFVGLNYEHREVRDFYFAQIRELVNDYDFDGMELDWTRHLPIFEMPASQKNIETITGWIAEIRALTEANAGRTGKRYPLGMRVLADLDKCRSFGIDVRELARLGLIDFVVAADFYHTSWDTPHDRLRAELGDDISVYGTTETIANWLMIPSTKQPGVEKFRYMAASPPLLRGNAAGKLALGADGIEQFNFFCADAHDPNLGDPKMESGLGMRCDYPALRGIAELENLRGKPKHYTLSMSPTVGWMPPHIEAVEQLPALIEFGSRRAFNLPMAREPLNSGLSLTLQVVIEKREKLPDLGVSFNGSWPTFDAKPTDQLFFPTGPFNRFGLAHQTFNYRLDLAGLKEGWNEVVVYCGSHDASTTTRRNDAVRIVSIEIAVM